MNDTTVETVTIRRPVSTRPKSSGDLEDLDVAAARFAREWTVASAQRRRELRADLVVHCLPFASRMAFRYRGRGEPLEDLEQVAWLGLINAIDRYDPDRGSFTAFAVITIRGELKRHFRDKTWALHVNRRGQDLALELQHATVLLTNVLKREPDTAELAKHLDVSEDDIQQARLCRACYTPVPLSTPIGAEGTLELSDTFGAPDEALEAVADKVTVAKLIRLLPDRIQHMLALRFHGNRTQAQIAAEFGVSQMHVSRLLARAMEWLRAAMLSDVPPPWAPGADHSEPDGLRIRLSRAGGDVTVQVCGEIDRDNADRLRISLHSAVSTASAGRVVIDVAAMPLLEAAGVAVLRDAFVAAALANVTVTLMGVRPHVAPVLAAVGLPTVNRR